MDTWTSWRAKSPVEGRDGQTGGVGALGDGTFGAVTRGEESRPFGTNTGAARCSMLKVGFSLAGVPMRGVEVESVGACGAGLLFWDVDESTPA